VAFDLPADHYDRFMGRFSVRLAPLFLDRLGDRLGDALAPRGGAEPGRRVLDVGCGPGALTTVLAERLGAEHVAAVDPSEPFVRAARDRLPGVDVRVARAEALPYPDATFDACLAQLVVHFLADPVAGLGEMRRVTRPGGVVGCTVWDHAGGGPLQAFWQAAADLDPSVRGEAELPGTRRGHLGDLMADAGLVDVEESTLVVRLRFSTLAEWWEPFTLGVGPAGDHVSTLDDEGRAALLEACRRRLPAPPFTVSAAAWCAVGRV
jgi:SAM-dependent methyltransferase